MSTSSSTSSEGTGEYTQPVRDLQDKKQLQELLHQFFSKNNISNVMREITGNFSTPPSYSLSDEGFSVVDALQGEGQPTKFEILYKPKEKHKTPCPNHFVDKALEIALREVGYEVKVGQADNESPHTRSMIVTINPYILDAIKNGEQNQFLKRELETNVAKLNKEKETLAKNLKKAKQGSESVGLLLTKNSETLQKVKIQNKVLEDTLNESKRTHFKQITELQKKLEEVKKENQTLTKDLVKNEAFMNTVQADNIRCAKQLQKNSAQNKKLKQQNQSVRNQLKTKLQELQKEEKQNQTLKRDLMTSEDDCFNRIIQKEASLLKENTKLNKQNHTLKNNFKDKVAQNQQLKKRLELEQTEKENLKGILPENDRLKKELEEKQSQNKKLKSDLDVYRMSNMPFQMENVTLKQQNLRLTEKLKKDEAKFAKELMDLTNEVALAIKRHEETTYNLSR